ncbi:S8 family peptidase [Methylobacter marinus]|uniref:S8 family peptidase n=1 Tax=Methylobacter marinus TaxID=34058 RepID=UPI00039D42FB|nr:S8 family peptidase [Methylobacter marinus]
MDESQTSRRHHFVLSNTSQTEPYTPITRGGGDKKLPELDRATHGQKLLGQLSNLKSIAEKAKNQQQQAGINTGLGLQIQFSSLPDVELAIQSLSDTRAGIELMNVRHDEHHTYATVFVPDGKLDIFERKIQEYIAERKGNKGQALDNKALINTISEIRTAAFNELWTDDLSALPASEQEPIWWEIWLPILKDRISTNHHFRSIAEQIGFELSLDELHFPERSVLLMYGTQMQIQQSMMLLNSIAELKRAKETAEFFDSLAPTEQREWTNELLERTKWPLENAPHVCILDTGINAKHPLLAQSLNDEDQHTIEPSWGVADQNGHGTEMAGLTIWGDLTPNLANSAPVVLTHHLESVKLLPHDGGNVGRHHGNLMLEAIARPEITAPYRQRVFSMAVTAKDNRDQGKPSAWSATLDRLACDVDGEGHTPRLFIVSGGNIDDPNAWSHYPYSNSTDSIHDPGQAWNVLTVGAYTQKIDITEANTDGYSAIAPSGGLSPFSTTSQTWQRHWPLKPDVVFEGGNAAKDALGPVTMHSLSLLTTSHELTNHLLTTTNATSAATALCSRMAAQLIAQYPNLWPETVRALIVHSAEWTEQMKAGFLDRRERSGDYQNLIRHCGFGVPNLERALWSASNSLTLIVQDELQPFVREKDKGEPKLREMHLHSLPWPQEILMNLGATLVEMRVTLSYFIEPSPGIVERGAGGRYCYESHSLRFDVKRPEEKPDDFRARINQRVRDAEEGSYTRGGSDSNWLLGPDLRHRGSLHSDMWTGTAAALAERGILAVYPVTGWWKTRKKEGRYDQKARYALIISIRTPETDVDLYNAIENLVAIST